MVAQTWIKLKVKGYYKICRNKINMNWVGPMWKILANLTEVHKRTIESINILCSLVRRVSTVNISIFFVPSILKFNAIPTWIAI